MGCSNSSFNEIPENDQLLNRFDDVEPTRDWMVEYPDEEYTPTYSLQISANSGSIAGTNEKQLAYQNQPPQKPSTTTKSEQQKKIIKTANIKMEISNYEEGDQQIRDLVNMMDGYIAKEDQENQYYQKLNKLVVRIAPEKLENFLHQLEKLAKKVAHKQVSSKDVTKDFVDMYIRIKSKEEVIERYRALLKQAKTVEEILKVEEELRQVVEELESVKGQLNYLKNQVGLSTVTIHYFEILEQVDGAESPSFFAKLGKALSGGWSGLMSFIIGVVYLWPFVIISGFLLYYFRKYWKRRRLRLNQSK